LDDNPSCSDHLKLSSHKININNKTLLSSIFKLKSARVNTFHHQAVGKLGKNLIVSAIASDGVVEAIETPNKKMLAVQWHPELTVNKQNASIFKWLTK
jgi:gamma-glutamyl-gamma-aminobutyrate hydrolase PuuD